MNVHRSDVGKNEQEQFGYILKAGERLASTFSSLLSLGEMLHSGHMGAVYYCKRPEAASRRETSVRSRRVSAAAAAAAALRRTHGAATRRPCEAEEGTFGGNSSQEFDPRTDKQPGPRGATVEPRTMSAPSAKSSRKENSNHGGGDESSGKLRGRRFISAMFAAPAAVPVGQVVG